MVLSVKEKERRKQARRQEKYNKTHKTINDIDHKLCSICETWKPSTHEYYYKNSSNKIDGLNPYCKECTIKKSYSWIQDNYDQFNETRKEGYFKSKKFKRWSKKNFEEMKDYNREWRRKNKDKVKTYRLKREESKNHNITKDELDSLYVFANSSCMYCGIREEEAKEKYGQRLHRDHAVNKGSDGIDNCILACRSCNSSKHNKDWNEWYTEDNERYSEIRYSKIVEWLSSFSK